MYSKKITLVLATLLFTFSIQLSHAEGVISKAIGMAAAGLKAVSDAGKSPVAPLVKTPKSPALEMIESRFAFTFLTKSKEGEELAKLVIGKSITTETEFKTFVEYINALGDSKLIDEVAEKLTSVRKDFLKQLNGEWNEATSVLTSEQRKLFETTATSSFGKLDEISALMQKHGPVKYSMVEPDAPPVVKGAPPNNPVNPVTTSSAPIVDPRLITNSIKLGLLDKAKIRFTTYGRLMRAFRFSEGDFLSLFGITKIMGRDVKAYTHYDLKVIRRFFRIIQSFNEYAKTRLVIETFLYTDPAIYRGLAERIAVDTERFMAGQLNLEAYLRIRSQESINLGIDSIVIEADKRMITAITKCRQLGRSTLGGTTTEGKLEVLQKQITSADNEIAQVNAQILLFEGELAGNAKKAATAAEDATAKAIEGKSDVKALMERAKAKVTELKSKFKGSELETNIRRELNNLRGQLDGQRQARAGYADDLEKTLEEFVINYEQLNIFINLKNGIFNGKEVGKKFVTPPMITASQAELDVWFKTAKDGYKNISASLVRSEFVTLLKSRLYATRAFVSKLNNDAGKLVGGVKFTDTEQGQKLKSYSQSLMTVTVIRFMYLSGVGIPTLKTVFPNAAEALAESKVKDITDTTSGFLSEKMGSESMKSLNNWFWNWFTSDKKEGNTDTNSSYNNGNNYGGGGYNGNNNTSPNSSTTGTVDPFGNTDPFSNGSDPFAVDTPPSNNNPGPLGPSLTPNSNDSTFDFFAPEPKK